jgi:Ni/Co efflux regulator RcnB
MKKVFLLLAACAFTTASFAQTTPTTEVKTRDNGTQKVVTKTGKTNVGQALENTADATKNVASKAGHKIKHGTQKVGSKVKHGTQKMEAKTE